MIGFKEYKEVTEMQDKIALLMYMAENDEMINESYDMDALTEVDKEAIVKKTNSWLDKVGMKLHKGTGIIDYLKVFSKGAGKLIMAAIRKDKDEVKAIANTIEKEKVLDFLLKLDMATMHIVTGPIHTIDAVTGWDLMANIKKAAETADDKLKIFYDAINKVKNSIKTVLGGERQKKMLRVADNLEYNMPNIDGSAKD